MTHCVLRTIQLGLAVISFLLLGACANGPGGNKPTAEPEADGGGRTDNPAQPLYWADVLEKHDVPEATYAIGIYVPGYGTEWIGTGFAAHYTTAIWTNAHVVVGMDDTLVALEHRNPVPLAVQSGKKSRRDKDLRSRCGLVPDTPPIRTRAIA